MLRELISIFRSSDPLAEVGDNFGRMLKLTEQMNELAGEVFFGEGKDPSRREQIYTLDRQVNELEQTIRRQVLTHLAVSGNEADLPYCLLLISLVKDVERLGDYAKNLSGIVDIRPDGLPEGRFRDELMSIRRQIEHTFEVGGEVFAASRHDQAAKLIADAREVARRCDRLVADIGHGDHDAATTTALILGTRYYKRIGGHLLNVLTSVVMPLDKIDYYDEEQLPRDAS